ncbi:MAG: hypothetical protein GX228_05640 [Firmicutes bacterium]|jgi:aldose 1-epimerase|nr:hypothetical protein [Bacillota bacterium]NLL88406.1 hypothetical protein [Bacillota bacterium]HKM17573.1 hypothetical protein [Limnochordia bacterium]
MQAHSDLVLLENDCLQVGIAPTVGASIFSFKYKYGDRWVDVMRPTPKSAVKNNEPGSFSSFNMIPYSNRIKDGILTHKAHTYRLAINSNDGHAIHGEVRNRPWSILDRSGTRLELEFTSTGHDSISWPFAFSARICYQVDANRCLITTAVQNLSDEEMPAGMGIHPYFVRSLTEEDDRVIIQLPILGVYPGETPIPTGKWEAVPPELDFSKAKELSSAFIDKCFRVGHEPAVIEWPNSRVRLQIEWDPVYEHLILYCPRDDQRFFAVEPVTNCNNGFNLTNQGLPDTGTVYLKPQAELRGKITLVLSQC